MRLKTQKLILIATSFVLACEVGIIFDAYLFSLFLPKTYTVLEYYEFRIGVCILLGTFMWFVWMPMVNKILQLLEDWEKEDINKDVVR